MSKYLRNNFYHFILVIFIYLFITGLNFEALGQDYFFTESTSKAHNVTFNNGLCGCSMELLGPSTVWQGEITYSIEGVLYSIGNWAQGDSRIHVLDPGTGNVISTLMIGPAYIPTMSGFVSVGNGVFYSKPPFYIGSDTIYRWDVNSNTVTSLGTTGFLGDGGMAMSDGQVYYAVRDAVPGMRSIVRLDQSNPSNSTILVNYPLLQGIGGLTSSPYCNVLIGVDVYADNFVSINLIDGSIESICSYDNINGIWITSMYEYIPLDCSIYLDLDCNDSSGATDADYNSQEYTCLSDGVGVCDEDIKMLFDDIVTSMTIKVEGNIPDAPDEILEMTGSIPNINVSGIGTDMITLTNGGGAKSTDFKDALRLILYKDLASPLTPGPRTVEVQFTTASGAMSNIATAFIEVTSLPLVDVDLGPDLFICEGESTILDAGIPGAAYTWSTGAQTQAISVTESGLYMVTVADGINCPGRDTLELNVVPIIQVALEGDFEICDNESAELIIETNTPFSLTVDISSNPGSPFHFNGINEDFTFNDFPTQTTIYIITNVSASDSACFNLTDPIQIVDVYPAYTTTSHVTICEGDSIWLGFFWETEPGIYENTLNTIHQCDSTVITNLTVLPAVNISLQSTTCDSASAGVFYQYLNNPTGCDTVIQTTVTLLSSDTTYLSLLSCNSANTGVFIDTLTNTIGCDSLVITTVSSLSPEDTTNIVQLTCDSSMLGIVQQLHADQAGCDSLVIITTLMSPADTTYQYSTSCDPGEIGVFQNLLDNQSGCDSLIISTVTPGIGDTTYAASTSCDSSSLGVFEEHFVSQSGCDSTVFTTITYSASDSTFLNSTSCDPDEVGVFTTQFVNWFGCDSIVTTAVAYVISHNIMITSFSCNAIDTGVFVQNLVNQFGCDSIVTETVLLLPGDETFISSTTCMSSEAGVFITNHINQNGCDSIVTLTVSLIPADTTTLLQKTCDPNQTGSIEVTHTNTEGCDSLVITTTELYPLPEVQLQITSDFNGYPISCAGESDGSLIANSTGEEPFTYLWSTGSFDQSITGLAAGAYSVTVTDGNGCITNGEIVLFDPPPFMIRLIVSHPDCFDDKNGSITIAQTGGTEPVRYSIDGINYQGSPTFNELSEGSYQLTAFDANDCEVKEIILINAPLQVDIELGDDMILTPGDSATIHAIVNVPFDSLASVVWSGLNNPPCENCLTQIVEPIITTTYSVTVSTHDGCMDSDQLTLFVERENDVYVPNIFSPNGDGVNDELVVYGGEGVEEIASFIVFDRWGNVVFNAEHFQVNDVTKSWDGSFKGERLNPGVFAYKMIVKFKDGTSDVVYGDVTMIR